MENNIQNPETLETNNFNQNPQIENNYYQNQMQVPMNNNDLVALASFKHAAKTAAICYCLFLLIIPTIVGLVFSIIAGVKGLSLKNKNLHDDFFALSIMMIVFGILILIGAIVVGFIINGKAGSILKATNSSTNQ